MKSENSVWITTRRINNESIWQNSFDSFGIAWGEIHGNALADGLIKRSQILLYSTLIVVTLHVRLVM